MGVTKLPCAGRPPTLNWGMTRYRSPRGFTLLEICVVMGIAVLLMGLAVPSLTGQMSRRRLQESFDRLNTLVSQARELSMKESKPYLLAWDNRGSVRLYPADLNNEARRKQGPTASLLPERGSDGKYALFRPSALASGQPSAEWTFWPSGTCEPVIVKYEGSGGYWEAAYNALSGRAVLSKFIAQ